MFDSKKRKRHRNINARRNYRASDSGDGQGYRARHREPEEDSVLFIQAHEADIRRGPHTKDLALSLEVVDHNYSDIDIKPGQSRPKIGSALILWSAGSGSGGGNFNDDNEDTIHLGAQTSNQAMSTAQNVSEIRVDRYDARLLLDALPDFESPQQSASKHEIPGSPSGWSDLPSDTEETFFFSPEEVEDSRNEKRRRLMEQAREERVKARMKEENEAAEGMTDEDPWGGSDEEPDDAQKEFMRRTAAHLLSSPNTAQLEMRILANHGADKRFAFLKGRWNRSWRLIKAKLRIEKEENERRVKQGKESGLGVLAGYDSDSDSNDNGVDDIEQGPCQTTQQEEQVMEPENETKKEIRRQKAKEWAERRRADKSAVDNQDHSN